MQLSKHFTLEDLTGTTTGLDNTPTVFAESNLRQLAALLDLIYDQIGPFRVTSAYRSSEVNDEVGGAEGSLHLKGMAADIRPLNDSPYNFFIKILNSSIFNSVGELINEADEKGVVHISLPSAGKRSSAMYLRNGNYVPYSYDELVSIRQGNQLPSTFSFDLNTSLAIGAVAISVFIALLVWRAGKK